MTALRVSRHAIDRYQERVAHRSSPLEARIAIEQIALRGRARATPRRWMNDRRPVTGTTYVYWSARPGICAVVVDRTVVTVITKSLTKSSPLVVEPDRRGVGSPRPVDEIGRWRWNGELDEAA